MSPATKTSGCPGTASVGSGAIRHAERRGERRRGNARRPEHGLRRKPLGDAALRSLSSTRRPPGHAVLVDCNHERRGAHFDAKPFERAPGGRAELLRERRQHVGAAFEEHDPCRLRANAPEILWQRFARDLGERAGQFDARRAAADDGERQQAALSSGIRFALGCFERQQHAPADVERIVQRLQPGRTRFPFWMAEVRVRGPARDDQIVIRDRAAIELQLAFRRVDSVDIRQQHLDVFLLPQDPPNRRGDIAR
jgi:hypothetical protein